MANIFKTTAILSNLTGAPIPVFTAEEMEAMVLNYWGSASAEKTFPITFWKLEHLFATSPTQEVALRVTDIGNSTLVDASWIPFEENAIQDAETVYYFVFNKTYFTGPIEIPGTPPKKLGGVSKSVANAQNGLVIGRLGKDEKGSYQAFFKAGEYQMTSTTTRDDSGDGSTSGVKIP